MHSEALLEHGINKKPMQVLRRLWHHDNHKVAGDTVSHKFNLDWGD